MRAAIKKLINLKLKVSKQIGKAPFSKMATVESRVTFISIRQRHARLIEPQITKLMFGGLVQIDVCNERQNVDIKSVIDEDSTAPGLTERKVAFIICGNNS